MITCLLLSVNLKRMLLNLEKFRRSRSSKLENGRPLVITSRGSVEALGTLMRKEMSLLYNMSEISLNNCRLFCLTLRTRGTGPRIRSRSKVRFTFSVARISSGMKYLHISHRISGGSLESVPSGEGAAMLVRFWLLLSQ